MNTFGNLFPRITHVQQTHRAVKFAGSHAKELSPGIHWWWPLTTEIEEIPVARQTVNLPSQSLVTADGKSVVVGGVVIYSIKSAMDAICKNYDHEDTLKDVSMCTISRVISGLTWNDLLSEHRSGQLRVQLTKSARQSLRPFGFRVSRADLTDISPARVFRVFQDRPSNTEHTFLTSS
jgi:regulator of protease activity HflC (stomatin/prohibitin superfamily)